MSENIKMEDLQASTPEVSEETVEATTETVPEQNPLKEELEKVKKKEGGRTELEKAIFTKNQIENRIRELTGEDNSTTLPEDDEDAPVTIGMLKKMQREASEKSAAQLANEITDETERELTKYHLANSIKSTGNPQEDIHLARAIVNAAKNKQILDEVARKIPSKTHSSASSAPAKVQDTSSQELTKAEMPFSRPPFNMTKEAILKLRK